MLVKAKYIAVLAKWLKRSYANDVGILGRHEELSSVDSELEESLMIENLEEERKKLAGEERLLMQERD